MSTLQEQNVLPYRITAITQIKVLLKLYSKIRFSLQRHFPHANAVSIISNYKIVTECLVTISTARLVRPQII